MSEEPDVSKRVAQLERSLRRLRGQFALWLALWSGLVAIVTTVAVLWISKHHPLWRGDTIIARRFVVEDHGQPRATFGMSDYGWPQLMLGPDDRRFASIGLAVMDTNRAQAYVNGSGHISSFTGSEILIMSRNGEIVSSPSNPHLDSLIRSQRMRTFHP